MRVAALFALCAILRAQETAPKEVTIRSHAYTPPPTVLNAETTLVEASLVVRDSRGRPIGGLRASDFDVLDNGVPQKIVAFSELRSDRKAAAPAPVSTEVPAASIPPPQPKYVTFFFDDFHGGAGLFVMKAARAFIAKGMKPTDYMSIVTASGQGDLDFTNDAAVVAEKLNHLASHERRETTMRCGVGATESYIVVHNLDYDTTEKAIAAATPCAGCGPENPAECRSKVLQVAQQMATMMWEQSQVQSVNTLDALSFAAKRLSEVNGTRILVMNSGGFLISPGLPQIQKIIDNAVRWNIVIHAIGGGLGMGDGGPKGLLHESLFAMPLEKVTDGTGGHYFKNTNDLAGGMDLAANPEITYLLAFNPVQRDGKFHNLAIRFKVKRPESVQFRPGYFSPLPEPPKKLAARAAMDAAVFTNETLREIQDEVEAKPGELKDGTVPVVITVTVDMNDLEFKESNERSVQQIVFLMTLLDSQGTFVTGKEAIMDLALSGQKLEALKRDGLKAVATLNAPPGVYQARIVVREGMKGKLAASTIAVDLK
jgi:VWFA-related protein